MSTEYYHTVLPSLPAELAMRLEQLCHRVPSTEPLLDAVIRFICGAGCPETFSDTIRSQWSEKQQEMRKALYILHPSSLDLKRPREDDTDIASGSKRRKLTTPNSDASLDERSTPDVGEPVFTLRSISVTSPIRKKVDITIHKTSIRFTSPGTHSIEATAPLSALNRAFLLPTRGKNKAHWTIVLISSDTPDRGKLNSSSAQTFPQVIFGVDATTTSPLTTTRYNSKFEPTNETVPKGGATLPLLKTFLSHLVDVQILEPTTNIFTSACSGYGANAGQNGIPGVEAYRAAKAGSLWFMKEGILWGESKPCEFWAVEDLIGKSEGLRLLTNPGGRTCSVTLTRRSDDQVSLGEEDVRIESEFTMIDSREQEGITQWVRKHQHLFGRKEPGKEEKVRSPAKAYAGPMTIYHFGGASDDEDDEFEMESGDEDDSSGSSSESDEGSDKKEESDAQDSDAEGSDEEVEELREEHHPLLQRGAVPRMSKAAIEMVVGIVEEDFMGGKGASSGEEAEEDELDD